MHACVYTGMYALMEENNIEEVVLEGRVESLLPDLLGTKAHQLCPLNPVAEVVCPHHHWYQVVDLRELSITLWNFSPGSQNSGAHSRNSKSS